MSKILYPRMHVSLYVRDIASTVNFYSTFFGQKASKLKRGYAKYELSKPGLIISFVENEPLVNSNFGHLGIQVESKEEMERMLLLARAKGIVSLEEIGTACCYAIQDKFWVTDPDGIQWEVYYFHKDSDFNDPNYSSSDSSSACCSPIKEERLEEVEVLKSKNCTPDSGCC